MSANVIIYSIWSVHGSLLGGNVSKWFCQWIPDFKMGSSWPGASGVLQGPSQAIPATCLGMEVGLGLRGCGGKTDGWTEWRLQDACLLFFTTF